MIMTSSSSSPEVESNIAATAVPHRGTEYGTTPSESPEAASPWPTSASTRPLSRSTTQE